MCFSILNSREKYNISIRNSFIGAYIIKLALKNDIAFNLYFLKDSQLSNGTCY